MFCKSVLHQPTLVGNLFTDTLFIAVRYTYYCSAVVLVYTLMYSTYKKTKKQNKNEICIKSKFKQPTDARWRVTQHWRGKRIGEP